LRDEIANALDVTGAKFARAVDAHERFRTS